ncbi:hypothetical protein HN51_024319, partial [Arachis hypogaea]
TRDGVTVTERGREQISRASSPPTIEKTRRPPSESRASSSSSPPPPPPSPPPRHLFIFNDQLYVTSFYAEEICKELQCLATLVHEELRNDHLVILFFLGKNNLLQSKINQYDANFQGVKCGIYGANCPGWIINMEVVAGELELNHECSLMHWSSEDFESKLQFITLIPKETQGILINGQFPGPTIDAVTNDLKIPGDELEVNLKSWAVKRLTRGTTDETIGDFLSELGIMAHVSHTNTAKLVGYGVEGGMHLVLELSEKGSLASVLYGSRRSFRDLFGRELH